MRDVVPIWIEVPRAEIGYVKFVFESYEGVAVVRTWDPRVAVLIVLAAPDFLDQARRILDGLTAEVGLRLIECPVAGQLDLLGPEGPQEEPPR